MSKLQSVSEVVGTHVRLYILRFGTVGSSVLHHHSQLNFFTAARWISAIWQ